jgi:hypothetical protein
MGILMASLAFPEADARVFDDAIGLCMTLGALQARMPTSEGELRRLVIELRDRREIVKAMAAFAFQSQLTLMLVLVACCASCRQPQESSRSLLHFRLAQFVDIDELDLMAVSALLPGVRADEGVPRLVVIEPLLTVRPMHQLKIASNVVPVAGSAIASLLSEVYDRSVIAAVRRDPLADLGVAVNTFENRSAGAKGVALIAAQRALQVPMCVGQTSGRQLAENSGRRSEECDDRDDFSKQLHGGRSSDRDRALVDLSQSEFQFVSSQPQNARSRHREYHLAGES